MDNRTDKEKLQDLYVKEKFQQLLIQELLSSSTKIIENYKRIVEIFKQYHKNPENKLLNSSIMSILYIDIDSRAEKIKKMKSVLKSFNKTYKLKKVKK